MGGFVSEEVEVIGQIQESRSGAAGFPALEQLVCCWRNPGGFFDADAVWLNAIRLVIGCARSFGIALVLLLFCLWLCLEIRLGNGGHRQYWRYWCCLCGLLDFDRLPLIHSNGGIRYGAGSTPDALQTQNGFRNSRHGTDNHANWLSWISR